MRSKYFENSEIQRTVFRHSVFLCDMNGVIIDDEMLHLIAMNRALEKLGYEAARFDYFDWVKKALGRPGAIVLSDALASLPRERQAEVMVEKESEFEKLFAGRLQSLIRPGFRDFLKFAKTHGKKVAVVTSASQHEANRILGRLALNIAPESSNELRLDAVITRDDAERPKPAPDIYHGALERLKIRDRRSCVAFEDSDVGVQAAKAAGLKCVAIPSDHTRHHDLSGADLIISSWQQSAEIMDNEAAAKGPIIRSHGRHHTAVS